MGAQEVNVTPAITFLQEVSEIGNAFGARIVCDAWTSKERFAFQRVHEGLMVRYGCCHRDVALAGLVRLIEA